MKSLECGLLLNKAGKKRYFNEDAHARLIRYVTRTNGMPKDGLAAWGGLGVAEFMGVAAVIDQFCEVQKTHTRQGGFGRRADHEVYSFSRDEERLIRENRLDVDGIARAMAYDFYERDHCQVVYGVHKPDNNDSHLHVHFVINSVDYATGNKRRENRRQTRERQERFGRIVRERAGI